MILEAYIFIGLQDTRQNDISDICCPHCSLQEEKRILEREYSRLPKKEEIDKQTKELNKHIEDLRLEIGQRQLEAKNLREELSTRQRQIELERKEVEREVEQQDRLKEELVQVHSLPGQLLKDMDKMNKQKK